MIDVGVSDQMVSVLVGVEFVIGDRVVDDPVVLFGELCLEVFLRDGTGVEDRWAREIVLDVVIDILG